MAVDYWTPVQILNQVAGEVGVSQYTTVVGLSNIQSIQLLSLLNAAGNELLLYYPWEQFVSQWEFTTTIDEDEYDVPDDLGYFTDQTQWDRTNHWPLLGPKSPQEWAWLKGSLVASLPRIRYRIFDNQLKLFPPPPGEFDFAMEYVSKNWLTTTGTPASMIIADADIIRYNPWLLIKFVKFKFYELKGFPTAGVQADFMRIFNSLTGKDTGAPKLSLSPVRTSQLLGPWSVPDGSWNVN